MMTGLLGLPYKQQKRQIFIFMDLLVRELYEEAFTVLKFYLFRGQTEDCANVAYGIKIKLRFFYIYIYLHLYTNINTHYSLRIQPDPKQTKHSYSNGVSLIYFKILSIENRTVL